MNDALTLIRYIISKFFNFMFSSYIFQGVSLGMILVVVFIFGILISNLLNTPQYFKEKKSYELHSKNRRE